MEEIIIKYGPLAMFVAIILLKSKIFVTPKQLEEALGNNKDDWEKSCEKQYVTKEDMQLERKELLEEVERRFLSVVTFREFEKLFSLALLSLMRVPVA